MVAYSFKSIFAASIEARIKCQTIRADRRRHARPGEALQLFVGMRTKHCRKIVADPICISVEPITIEVGLVAIKALGIVSINVAGVVLSADASEKLAIADGFIADEASSALLKMAMFWLDNHGPGLFSGVIIRWRD